MDYRIGTCAQCGAEYKVPASFAHNQARCKKCSGTVNLGSPQAAGASAPGAASARMPARKLGAMEEVKAENAETKRKERGTLAKLRAERAAAAKTGARPVPATKAPAAPVDPEATTKLSTRRHQSKPAAVAAATPAPAADEAAEAGQRPASRSSRGAGGRSRSKGKDGESKGRRGRSKPEKKKSPMLLIALVTLVLGGGGFAAWKYLWNAEDALSKETQAAETPVADADSGEEDAALEPGEAGEDAAEDSTPEATAEDTDAPEETADADSTPEDVREPDAKQEPVLAEIASLAACQRARGTTDQEWEEMNGWMTDFLDLDSGAAGPRAGKKLANMGRKAMPVLINGLLTLDYSTEAGINTGDSAQRMLKTIANGNNFNWGYLPDPRAEYLCRGAVAKWHQWWKLIEGDISFYIKLAKLEQEWDGDGPDPLGPLRAKRKAEAVELRDRYGKQE